MVSMSSQGMDLTNLNSITQAEADEYLARRWRTRGPLYDMYASSLMLDYAPNFLKLHRWSADSLRFLPSQRGMGNEADNDTEIFRVNEPICTIPQLYSYIHLGWETGIRNEFRVLKRLGFTRAQTMEIVLFARLSAGMRGLGHTYHAVGDFLPDYADGHGHPAFPEGWAPDNAAFKAGLDLTTREMTDQDRKNLTAWYEKNVGYLPNSIAFGIKHDPQFTKVARVMWETPFKLLPKQVAPYLMMRDAQFNNDRDALREAGLLAKNWGITSEWIVRAAMYTLHYFTGLRSLYVVHDALDDIL